ncbi:DNA-binding protein HU [compost metagenome]
MRERAAREGRNPRTGAVLKIPAKKSPVWTAGKTLKERVEGGKKTKAAAGKKK